MALKTEMSEKVRKRLLLAICSDQRTQLLLALNEGEKTVSDLRDAVQLDGPTIIHALRILEMNHFVSENGERSYNLTPIGKNVVRKVLDFYCATEAVVTHEKFWLEHDFGGIPEQLFDRIGALRDSTLVIDTQLDPFKAYNNFVELLKASHTLELIASVSAPDPQFLFHEFVEAHKHVELVVTESVLHHVIEKLGQARVKRALREGHKLYVIRQDPKLVFAVADHVIVLMLCRLDGGFDYSVSLTSESPEAIVWGHDVFRHYVESSESVTV